VHDVGIERPDQPPEFGHPSGSAGLDVMEVGTRGSESFVEAGNVEEVGDVQIDVDRLEVLGHRRERGLGAAGEEAVDDVQHPYSFRHTAMLPMAVMMDRWWARSRA